MLTYDQTTGSPSVAACCQAFLLSHPELNDPDAVIDCCYTMSQEFLISYPVLQGRLLFLRGQRTYLPYRHPRIAATFNNPDPRYNHVVILLPNTQVLDFTAKQLDSTGEPYTISTLAEQRNLWLHCGVEVMRVTWNKTSSKTSTSTD